MDKEYSNCIRCGRKLKSNESKLLGFGPICWEKYQLEHYKVKPLFNIKEETVNEDIQGISMGTINER